MKKILLAILIGITFSTQSSMGAESVFAKWKNWPQDPNFFPLVANMQFLRFINQYKSMGMNVYAGIDGIKTVTKKEMAVLKSNGMYLIGDAMDGGTWNNVNDKTLIAWSMLDEPDNWQYTNRIKLRGKTFPTTGGFFKGRIPPSEFVAIYNQVKSNDSTRPVICCFSQGVANDDWIGRGDGWNNDFYYEYCKGTDIAGFDVYPVVSKTTAIACNLYYQAVGLDRLRKWSNNKPLLNAIETTHINHDVMLPNPHQIRSEVWISIIHGVCGILYFLHEWKPEFNCAGLLKYPQNIEGITKINRQITQIASVINSPNVENRAGVVSSVGDTVPIDIMVKEQNGSLYIFSAGMRNGKTVGKFTVTGAPSGKVNVMVLGETRNIEMENGVFSDPFKEWDVHLYKIQMK